MSKFISIEAQHQRYFDTKRVKEWDNNINS
jgi:hypothetical protein